MPVNTWKNRASPELLYKSNRPASFYCLYRGWLASWNNSQWRISRWTANNPYQPGALFIYLFIHLFIYLFIYLFICLFILLFFLVGGGSTVWYISVSKPLQISPQAEKELRKRRKGNEGNDEIWQAWDTRLPSSSCATNMAALLRLYGAARACKLLTAYTIRNLSIYQRSSPVLYRENILKACLPSVTSSRCLTNETLANEAAESHTAEIEDATSNIEGDSQKRKAAREETRSGLGHYSYERNVRQLGTIFTRQLLLRTFNEILNRGKEASFPLTVFLHNLLIGLFWFSQVSSLKYGLCFISCLRSVFRLACNVGRRTVPLLNNNFGRKDHTSHGRYTLIKSLRNTWSVLI